MNQNMKRSLFFYLFFGVLLNFSSLVLSQDSNVLSQDPMVLQGTQTKLGQIIAQPSPLAMPSAQKKDISPSRIEKIINDFTYDENKEDQKQLPDQNMGHNGYALKTVDDRPPAHIGGEAVKATAGY